MLERELEGDAAEIASALGEIEAVAERYVLASEGEVSK